MSINDIISNISGNKTILCICVFILCSLIEVTPIKVNPLSFMVKCIRKLIGIDGLKSDILEFKFETYRKDILRYKKEKEDGIYHDNEERRTILETIDKYERITKDPNNDIHNGYCDDAVKYIKQRLETKDE